MRCDEAFELMSLYFDKELDKDLEEQLLIHIKNCSRCKKQFEEIQAVIYELNKIPLLDLPEGFHEELMEKVKCSKIENVSSSSKKTKKVHYGWKKYSTLAATFLLLLVVVGGVGSLLRNSNYAVEKSESSVSESPRMMTSDESAESEELQKDTDYPKQNNNFMVTSTDVPNDLKGNGVRSAPIIGKSSNGRVKIKKLNISIEVDNFDETYKILKSETENKGGYIENYYSDIYSKQEFSNLEYKEGNIVLRIPKEKYEGMKIITHDIGKVTNENETTEDITAQYVDTDNKLKMKRMEEERLLQLIDQSKNIEDIIKIEEQLSRVRTEIESYTTTINNWDRLEQFSSIDVHLIEVGNSKIENIDNNFGTKIKKSFINSINSVVLFLQSIAIFLAGYAVEIVILVVVLSALLVIIKRIVKRHKNMNINKE